MTEGAWFAQLALLVLIAFLHVGLAQFFVGGSLSDFLLGFRIFVAQLRTCTIHVPLSRAAWPSCGQRDSPCGETAPEDS